MAKTYAELLAEIRAKVRLVSLDELERRLAATEEYVLVDVREVEEWRAGHIPRAVHLPRSFLEMQAESRLPQRDAKVIVYCSAGIRSAFAAVTLAELGYEHVESANPGFLRWKELGYPVEKPPDLTPAQRERYSRQMLLPEVGEKGQERLLRARVLLLGAGGLGSPAALYLAAAGVGTIGIVDHDAVDTSNLQRQVLHATDRLGLPKVESGARSIQNLNPDVNVIAFRERLTRENIDRIFDQSWDVVIDGLDNFPTRYLANDASVWKSLPVVHGSIFRCEGQVTTLWPGKGPCYRCLYPAPPLADFAPSCAEAGVLGVLPGVIGTLQATEAIKIILAKGDLLVGRLLTYDAMNATFRTLRFHRDPGCPVCGESPTIRSYADYDSICDGRS